MNGISLIIPLYNKEDTIQGCLQKIFSQTVDNYEVIVVDDGSTDNSVENLQSYEGRIILIEQENQGPSAARNHGARIAKYDYLSFIDADDEITPEFVKAHLAVRMADPNISLSLNSFKIYEKGVLERTEYLFDRLDETTNESCLHVLEKFNHLYTVNIHSSGFCVDKDVFYRSAGFDEALRCWEISDALMRFSLEAERIAVINTILSHYCGDDNGLFSAEKNNLNYKELYCKNIMRIISRIPDESQGRYYKEIEYLCYDYWKALDLRKLAQVHHDAIGLPNAKQYFRLPIKIKLAAIVAGIFF